MGKRVKAGTSKAETKKRKALFVQEMIKNGGNATQAAIVAGYSAKSAKVTGSQLLTDPNIAAQIEAARSVAVSKAEAITGVSIERTLRECGRIAYADPRKLFGPDGNPIPIPDLDDDLAAAVASIEHVEEFTGRGADRELTGYTKKIKLWDKNSAIEKAMKHLGLFEKDHRQAGESIQLRVVFGRD